MDKQKTTLVSQRSIEAVVNFLECKSEADISEVLTILLMQVSTALAGSTNKDTAIEILGQAYEHIKNNPDEASWIIDAYPTEPPSATRH